MKEGGRDAAFGYQEHDKMSADSETHVKLVLFYGQA